MLDGVADNKLSVSIRNPNASDVFRDGPADQILSPVDCCRDGMLLPLIPDKPANGLESKELGVPNRGSKELGIPESPSLVIGGKSLPLVQLCGFGTGSGGAGGGAGGVGSGGSGLGFGRAGRSFSAQPYFARLFVHHWRTFVSVQ